MIVNLLLLAISVSTLNLVASGSGRMKYEHFKEMALNLFPHTVQYLCYRY